MSGTGGMMIPAVTGRVRSTTNFFFQVQPYNRKYRSIGHCVWSMSLNILTELSLNLFDEKHNSAEPFAHAQSVIVMQF